ncbi:helix-turn-helix transcriptional regulator [Brevibacterium litoralis]|uniref:helix-turn-helix transcriptional regulator n=1 Tax=Brevibacterium litoralis TaxID=3138935 RepID=UPI0032EB32AD
MDQARTDTDTEHRALAASLAHVLRTHRFRVSRTQAEVARDAGISRNPYQNLESGLSDRARGRPANPGLWTLFGISRALGVSLRDLVGEIEDGYTREYKRLLDKATLEAGRALFGDPRTRTRSSPPQGTTDSGPTDPGSVGSDRNPTPEPPVS